MYGMHYGQYIQMFHQLVAYYICSHILLVYDIERHYWRQHAFEL